jgi:hypothetical protein
MLIGLRLMQHHACRFRLGKPGEQQQDLPGFEANWTARSNHAMLSKCGAVCVESFRAGIGCSSIAGLFRGTDCLGGWGNCRKWILSPMNNTPDNTAY